MLIAIAISDAHHLGVLSSQVHIAWALAVGGRLGVGNDPRYNKSRCFETFPFPDNDTGLTPALRARIATLAEQIDVHRKRVLVPEKDAKPPGPAAKTLTLTGIYNVIEVLRAGRALTSKEKSIHEHDLCGVLKDLHDELDAAVLVAYGWRDLIGNPDADSLLQRLLTLNQHRAAEEQLGRIRWLRPEFQRPAAAPKDQQVTSWPASLTQQVRAVAELLAAVSSAGGPVAMGLADIEARFKGRGPWKRSLPRILETLEALGRARRDSVLWRA